MEQKPSKTGTVKRTIGAAGVAADYERSKTLAERIEKQKEVQMRQRLAGGNPVVFELIETTQTTGVYLKPKDLVYIPENYEQHEYIKDIVEVGEDGKPLTGVQEIRYVKNLNTIFVRNQPEKVLIEPVMLLSTNTFNDKKNKALISFLRLSNYNAENPVRETSNSPIYKELIIGNVAKKTLEQSELLFKAQEIVYSNDTKALYPLANVFGIDHSDPLVMKTSLLKEAQNDPRNFINLFNNEDLPIIERLVTAKALGIIDVVANRIFWKRTGETITYVSKMETDWVDTLVGFTKTEEGADFLIVLDKTIDEVLV
jgi:hypothetical protein